MFYILVIVLDMSDDVFMLLKTIQKYCRRCIKTLVNHRLCGRAALL